VARKIPSMVDWAGAVAIVEEMLGERIVHGDDRILERAVLGHGAQANDAVVVPSVPPITLGTKSRRL